MTRRPMDELLAAADEEATDDDEATAHVVREALALERESWADPHEDGAHPSFHRPAPTRADVERVWREFWLPSIRDHTAGCATRQPVPGDADGATQPCDCKRPVVLEKLKGELFDCHHLIMNAPRVYHHVTGGRTDDATASAAGVIALADDTLAQATRALTEAVSEANGRAQLATIRAEKAGRAVKAARAVVVLAEAYSGPAHGDALVNALEQLEKALNALEG